MGKLGGGGRVRFVLGPMWDHWLYCGLTNHRSVIKGRLECEFGQLLGPLISELDSTLAFPTVKESTDDT